MPPQDTSHRLPARTARPDTAAAKVTPGAIRGPAGRRRPLGRAPIGYHTTTDRLPASRPLPCGAVGVLSSASREAVFLGHSTRCADSEGTGRWPAPRSQAGSLGKGEPKKETVLTSPGNLARPPGPNRQGTPSYPVCPACPVLRHAWPPWAALRRRPQRPPPPSRLRRPQQRHLAGARFFCDFFAKRRVRGRGSIHGGDSKTARPQAPLPPPGGSQCRTGRTRRRWDWRRGDGRRGGGGRSHRLGPGSRRDPPRRTQALRGRASHILVPGALAGARRAPGTVHSLSASAAIARTVDAVPTLSGGKCWAAEWPNGYHAVKGADEVVRIEADHRPRQCLRSSRSSAR